MKYFCRWLLKNQNQTFLLCTWAAWNFSSFYCFPISLQPFQYNIPLMRAELHFPIKYVIFICLEPKINGKASSIQIISSCTLWKLRTNLKNSSSSNMLYSRQMHDRYLYYDADLISYELFLGFKVYWLIFVTNKMKHPNCANRLVLVFVADYIYLLNLGKG